MRVLALLLGLIFLFAAGAPAVDFKPFPGAKLDEATTRKAREAAAQSPLQPQEMIPTIFLSDAPFGKVAAFYRGLAHEYKMPGSQGRGPQKLPGGKELQEAYFIFDGAKDLMTSRRWAKVQRPYVGGAKMVGSSPQFQDIRDVTVIIFSEGK